jgi:hypothetical protein
MPNLRRGNGRQLIGLLGLGPNMGPKRGRRQAIGVENQLVRKVEAGGIEPHQADDDEY